MASTNGITRIWTKQIAGDLVISQGDFAYEVSVLCSSGTCAIKGSASFKGMAADNLTLSEGQSFTIRSTNPGAPIDGLTISPAGTAEIMVAQG